VIFYDRHPSSQQPNMSDGDMSPAERPYEDILNQQIDEGTA
jgi:hypothetical protein